MRDNGMMEAFRVDDLLFLSFPKVRRESRFLLFPFCPSIGNHRRVSHHYSRNLGVNPNTFKYCGPLIETFRGDE